MARTLGILFIGDVVGFDALEDVIEAIPKLKERYETHFVVVNGENIVNGKGLTQKEADALFSAGVHVITTGNHIWENWKSRELLANNKNVLRPHNYPRGNAGSGVVVYELAMGKKIGVIQVQGRTYMQSIDCPFRSVELAVQKVRTETNIILVDFHADATGEKVSMGWFLDGHVSAVLGTHTHVQTADARVFPKGTAYISDVGMSGPYHSALGMSIEVAIKRLTLQTAHKYELAQGDIRVCGAHVTVDEVSGKALKISPFTMPSWEECPPRTDGK